MNRKEFSRILTAKAVELNGVKELARFLDRKYTTVYSWVTGAAPRENTVRDVCRRLGIAPGCVIKAPREKSVKIVDVRGYDFDNLMSCYQLCRISDPLQAWHFVALAATLTFSYFNKSGIQSSLHVDQQCVGIIQLQSIDMKLTVKPDGGNGICYVLSNRLGSNTVPVKQLTLKNLEGTIREIRSKI